MSISKIDGDLELISKSKIKKRRSKHEREADRLKISQLYIEGRSQYQIGQALGLSQAQVSVELANVRKNWIEQTTLDLDAIKAAQLMKIDKIEAEAWICFEKSKRVRKVSTKFGKIDRSMNPKGSPKINSFNVVEEEDLGDTRYLDIIKWCIEQRLKITGGYAAKETKMNINSTVHTTNVSRDEILELIASKESEHKQLEAPKKYIDAEIVESFEEEEDKVKEEVTERFKLLGQTKGLLCMMCEKVTWNQNDFVNRFCPNCNAYLEQDSDYVEKLKILDRNGAVEDTSHIEAAGTSQDVIDYNKHDQKLHKHMNDISELTNFGKSKIKFRG